MEIILPVVLISVVIACIFFWVKPSIESKIDCLNRKFNDVSPKVDSLHAYVALGIRKLVQIEKVLMTLVEKTNQVLADVDALTTEQTTVIAALKASVAAEKAAKEAAVAALDTEKAAEATLQAALDEANAKAAEVDTASANLDAVEAKLAESKAALDAEMPPADPAA